jgi:hypothetical protein
MNCQGARHYPATGGGCGWNSQASGLLADFTSLHTLLDRLTNTIYQTPSAVALNRAQPSHEHFPAIGVKIHGDPDLARR